MAFPSRIKQVLIFLSILVGVTFASTFGYWNKQLAYVLHQTTQATPAVSVSGVPAVHEKMEPDTLIIESLGIRAPIVYAQQADEDAFQSALQIGVVHYPGTALVGQKGNAYIFGHSSDYIWSKGSYKTIFALLPHIKNDDIIIASDSEGNKFTYRVIKTAVVESNDVSVLDQGDHSRKVLTVQTSYPVGTALKRFVAIAEIQSGGQDREQ